MVPIHVTTYNVYLALALGKDEVLARKNCGRQKTGSDLAT